MSVRQDPERRLSEALRGYSRGGRPVDGGLLGGPARPAPRSLASQAVTALVLALLGGAVLGVGLALLSLLAPGFLPALG
jgi:hypothetical protein